LDENIAAFAALWVWLNSSQVNQMTYEPMHSAQEQSVRVNEKISYGFVGHHFATLQGVRINVYFILISEVKSLRFEL